MKKILLASDGSASSRRAAEIAKNMLSAWPEATLVVVYVQKAIALPIDTVMPQVLFDEEADIAKQVEAHVMVMFDEYRDRVGFRTEFGVPANVICQTAQKIGADLIIVGSHGRGTVDRLLLGSVSNGVVNHATVPVLVAR
ncbi:MAG: universal stress protein [Alicyclobacillus sp.]|nr:universal stress protein [Alicyclobacillus sp.]